MPSSAPAPTMVTTARLVSGSAAATEMVLSEERGQRREDRRRREERDEPVLNSGAEAAQSEAVQDLASERGDSLRREGEVSSRRNRSFESGRKSRKQFSRKSMHRSVCACNPSVFLPASATELQRTRTALSEEKRSPRRRPVPPRGGKRNEEVCREGTDSKRWVGVEFKPGQLEVPHPPDLLPFRPPLDMPSLIVHNEMTLGVLVVVAVLSVAEIVVVCSR